MRFIVWGINYAPEITGIAPHNVALCEFLQQHDDDVEMVTAFAYYPAWRKDLQDRRRLFRTDVINAVPVYRCWHFVPARVSALKRIVHEATFVLISTLRALTLKRPDVYIIASPPLLLGMAAWLVSRIKGTPFVFHVQDLQPDAAVGLGMLRAGRFTRALYWLESFAYEHAARVSSISPEILDAFRQKGVPEKKLILFPNSVVLPRENEIPSRGKFRAKHGFGQDEFLAIYAGNLGIKQGLDILFDAAELLRGEKNLRIVIAGDGAARQTLEQQKRVRNLANVSMLPLQFGEDYKELLVDADVANHAAEQVRQFFFPSKILVTLAYASPIVTVADDGSALDLAVKEGGFGFNLLPGKPGELAQVLRDLAQGRERLRACGRAGREYVKRFDRDSVLSDFRAKLEDLV